MQNIDTRRAWFFWKVAQVTGELRALGYEFMPYEFYRSPADQIIKFQSGLSRVERGLHQVWLAIDLVNIVNGKLNWKDGDAYFSLDRVARTHDLCTGRDWKGLHDANHLEYPSGWLYVTAGKKEGKI